MSAVISEWYVPPDPQIPGSAKRGADMDATLGVRFGLHPVINTEKSTAEGRPIFDQLPYVMIHIPGDRLSVVHRPVRPEDKHRWPTQWRAFEAGQVDAVSGTPLDKCPALTPAEVAELRYFNVQTCEELVQMSDGNALRFQGVRAMQKKVADFLDAAKGAAHAAQLRAKLEAEESEKAALHAALADQGKKIEQLMALLAERTNPANENKEQPKTKR